MKKTIKDIIVYIIGTIAEIYIFLYLPYYEFEGAYVLLPIVITPIIGLVIGLFIKSNVKYVFVIATLIFSILFKNIYLKGIDEIIVIYILAYMFNTAVGIVTGHGIRLLALSIAEKIRDIKANK